MKNKCVLLILSSLLFIGCAKAKPEKQRTVDFESLMGKDLPAWQYVQTQEDYDNLHFYRSLFEKNKPLLQGHLNAAKIPKVLHFIWVGPKNFPNESVENVKSWMAKNPDWTIKFWTDRKRPLPHPAMQLQLVQNLKFLKLEECYRLSDNYAEKSDLLRYEILFQEGGVYVDHDIKCFGSFDSLNNAYDLYCGLELPSETPLSSSVHPTNNLIAARAGHPILKQCMSWLADNWDRIEKEYPGKDKEAVIQRVGHRTFNAFADAVKTLAGKESQSDMVFPAFYFNAPSDKLALLARHLYAGTWFENESPFEKMTRERLMMITKKTNKILLFFGVATALNLIGLAAVFLTIKKKKSINQSQ